MQAKITKQTDETATITVNLSESFLAKVMSKTLDGLRPKVKAAGFRAGKAPDHIVERELGANAIQAEVLDGAISSSYGQAVKDLELAAISAPKVSVAKFVPYTELEYTAEVPVLPPVKLPNLSKIKLKRSIATVDNTQIDQVVQDLQRRLAKRTLADRAAKVGDEVMLDFDGNQNGQPVAGASSKNYTLMLGSGTFIPGFEEEVIGLKSGAEKTFTIKFPGNYPSSNLAGQQVEFKIKVHQVYQIQLPPVDDKLAVSAGPFKTLAELRSDISAQIQQEKQSELDRQFENEAVDKVVSATSVKVPETLIDQQLESLRLEFNNNLAYQGMDIDKYLELSGKTQSQIDSELRPQAEKRVAAAVVLTEYAKSEGLKVAENEIHSELDRIKSSYPDLVAKSEQENRDIHNEVYNQLLSQKVMAKILSTVEVK